MAAVVLLLGLFWVVMWCSCCLQWGSRSCCHPPAGVGMGWCCLPMTGRVMRMAGSRLLLWLVLLCSSCCGLVLSWFSLELV